MKSLRSTRKPLAFLAVLFAAGTMTAVWAGEVILQRTGQEHRDCANCHQLHDADTNSPLVLKKGADAVCLGCHDMKSQVQRAGGRNEPQSSVSQHLWPNKSDWSRAWRKDDQRRFPGACGACHQPHEKEWVQGNRLRTLLQKSYSPKGERLPGRLENLAQSCFGCHGGNPITPGFSDGIHLGAAFSTTATSSHRIGSRGRADLPSLRGQVLSEPLDCDSCHGDSTAGKKGTHVSGYPKLLKARYEGRDGTDETLQSYALCYQCHDRGSILANESFTLHREHLTGNFPQRDTRRPKESGRPLSLQEFLRSGTRNSGGKKGGGLGHRPMEAIVPMPASCHVCHDSHGSELGRALIAFDRSSVFPNSLGQMNFVSSGSRQGSCNLLCHGHDHVGSNY